MHYSDCGLGLNNQTLHLILYVNCSGSVSSIVLLVLVWLLLTVLGECLCPLLQGVVVVQYQTGICFLSASLGLTGYMKLRNQKGD